MRDEAIRQISEGRVEDVINEVAKMVKAAVESLSETVGEV